jgi:hypothetical protein
VFWCFFTVFYVKKQTQSKSIDGQVSFEVIGVHWCSFVVKLKKQSQFTPALIDIKSFLKGDYDKNPAKRAEKNKANFEAVTALRSANEIGIRP